MAQNKDLDESKILKLATPIENFGKEITQLEYTGEVTGKMFREYGMPFKFHPDGSVDVNTESAAEYVEQVCGLQEGGFDLLRGKDCMQACMRLLIFFRQ